MDTIITNLREQLHRKDVADLGVKYVAEELQEDNDNNYFGVVTDNKDPLKIGRCKVRCYTLFGKDIPDEDLPWAIQDQSYLGSSLGNFIVPPIGTVVKVYFDHGDIYNPIYHAKGLEENNLPGTKDEDYPDTMVLWSTDNGEYCKINRKTNQTVIHTTTLDINIRDGKIAIGNSGGELLDILSKTIQALLDAKIPTMLGPQILSTVPQLTILKTKIDSIKGSL